MDILDQHTYISSKDVKPLKVVVDMEVIRFLSNLLSFSKQCRSTLLQPGKGVGRSSENRPFALKDRAITTGPWNTAAETAFCRSS